MTTQVKVQTNGNYVCEVKNGSGKVIGSAGPGSNVESSWISLPPGGASITERTATQDEIDAAKGTSGPASESKQQRQG